ncbi:TIGR02444 family protein [Aurantivibrio infirmus]
MNKEKYGVIYRAPTKSLDSIKSNPLSKFALALYSSPGVEETSIALQDSLGANVNLLLWCVWLESMSVLLSSEVLNQAEQTIFPLEKNIIAKLRQIRREIKARQIDTSKNQRFYQLIKRLELLAEMRVIESLWNLSEKYVNKTGSLEQGANVKFYLSSLGDREAGTSFISICDHALAPTNSK